MTAEPQNDFSDPQFPIEIGDEAQTGTQVANLAQEQPGHQTKVGRVRRSLVHRLRLPVILFLLTCCSTFFVGSLNWMPELYWLGGRLQAGGVAEQDF